MYVSFVNTRRVCTSEDHKYSDLHFKVVLVGGKVFETL